MTGLFDDADSNGTAMKYLFIAAPINIRIVTLPPPAFHPFYRAIIMDLYRKLLTRPLHYLLMKQHVSGRAPDGDVVWLIAALPCASGAGANVSRYLELYSHARYIRETVSRDQRTYDFRAAYLWIR